MQNAVQAYCRRRVGLSPGYRYLLSATVGQFSAWLGQPGGKSARPADVTVESLSSWLTSLLDFNFSSTTVNDKRRMLLTVLRSVSPSRATKLSAAVPPLQEPEDSPEAWTVEEVGELLWTAQHWPGMVGVIPARLFWDSLFSAVYWTGERIGAVRQVRSIDYCPASGWLTIRGRSIKTRRGRQFRLPDHCREKIDRIHCPGQPLLWPWPQHPQRLWVVARRIIERAGLPCPTTGRQLFHRLRRTNISYCWLVDPGLAQRQAGHSTMELTRRKYVDPRIGGMRTAADVLPVPAY